MELHREEENGDLEITNLKREILSAMQDDLDVEPGRFNDKSASWIEIKKRNDDNEISIVIQFNQKGNEIIDIEVWKAPIKTIVDMENQKRIG